MFAAAVLAVTVLGTPTGDRWEGRYVTYEYLVSIAIRLTRAKVGYVVRGYRYDGSGNQTITGSFDPIKNLIRGKLHFRPSGISRFTGHWDYTKSCFRIQEDQGDAIMDYTFKREAVPGR